MIYSPMERDNDALSGGLVLLHGGGFMVGDSSKSICRSDKVCSKPAKTLKTSQV